jgi:predicted AAA+ superfamily ATPase
VARSLTRDPKIYLLDWSLVDSEGAKIENFIASHLLKFGLYYLRDIDKREVVFFDSPRREAVYNGRVENVLVPASVSREGIESIRNDYRR